MIAEMYARGPIACTIAVTKEFEMYTGGVFNDTTGAKVSILTATKIFTIVLYILYFLN